MSKNKKKHQNNGITSVGIYHKDCLDGTTAAAVLLKKFPNIKFFPLGREYKKRDLEKIFSKVNKRTTVYIVDFALRADDELKRFAKKAAQVVVIDHHISDQKRLEKLSRDTKNIELFFHLKHSGASLAWMYFFGKKKMPRVIELVEDGDIGRWRFKKETTWIGGYIIPLLNQPEKIVKDFTRPTRAVLQQGKIISDFIEYLVDLYARRAQHIVLKIGKHKVVAYNATFNSERIRTLLGFILTKKHKATIAMFSIKGNEVHFSFRSPAGARPTSLTLARILHGGGHEYAAGAAVWLKNFCKMIVYKK